MLQLMASISPQLAGPLVDLMERFNLLYAVNASTVLIPPLMDEPTPSTGREHLKASATGCSAGSLSDKVPESEQAPYCCHVR